MTTIEQKADANPGDVVVVHEHAIGSGRRTGEILEVLGTPGHLHYRVRWDDGRESIFYPGSDVTIRPPATKQKQLTDEKKRRR